MQYKFYLDIYELFYNGAHDNEGELDIIKYLLHNMIVIEKNEDKNEYILCPSNNKNEKYKLKVSKNYISMNTLDIEPKEYRDFLVNYDENKNCLYYEHIIKKGDNILFLNGEISKEYNYTVYNKYKLNIKGYDKYSVELIKEYLKERIGKQSIIKLLDKANSELGIEPDLERIICSMIYSNLQGRKRICYHLGFKENEIYKTIDFSNDNNRLKHMLYYIMNYLKTMNLFDQLEKDETFRIY